MQGVLCYGLSSQAKRCVDWDLLSTQAYLNENMFLVNLASTSLLGANIPVNDLISANHVQSNEEMTVTQTKTKKTCNHGNFMGNMRVEDGV